MPGSPIQKWLTRCLMATLALYLMSSCVTKTQTIVRTIPIPAEPCLTETTKTPKRPGVPSDPCPPGFEYCLTKAKTLKLFLWFKTDGRFHKKVDTLCREETTP